MFRVYTSCCVKCDVIKYLVYLATSLFHLFDFADNIPDLFARRFEGGDILREVSASNRVFLQVEQFPCVLKEAICDNSQQMELVQQAPASQTIAFCVRH